MMAISSIPGMGSGIVGLFLTSGLVGQAIVVVLLGFSVISWSMILLKYQYLRRAEKESHAFLAVFRKTKNVKELRAEAETRKYSPLASLFVEGSKEIELILRSFPDGAVPDDDRPALSQEIDRALKITTQDEVVYLERYLAFIGTTGTVAPLLGLFGTIWGIMDSFYGIGIKGSGDISALAPGLAGALVTTIAGLFVAIPAVVAYNYFAERIRDMGARMDSFSMEFLSFMERTVLRRKP